MDKTHGFLNFNFKQGECDVWPDGVHFFQVCLFTLSFRPPGNSYHRPGVVDADQHSVPVCTRICDTTIYETWHFLLFRRQDAGHCKERRKESLHQSSNRVHSVTVYSKKGKSRAISTCETVIMMTRTKIYLNITCFTRPDLITQRNHDSGRQLWS